MPTLVQFKTRVDTLKTNLTTLKSEIDSAISEQRNTGATSSSLRITQDIARLRDEESNADRQFTEKAALMEAMGGKTREQTLQEFVLLFFYVGLVLFLLSITLVTYLNQGGSAASKIFGGGCVAILIVTALILRMA